MIKCKHKQLEKLLGNRSLIDDLIDVNGEEIETKACIRKVVNTCILNGMALVGADIEEIEHYKKILG